MTEVVNIVVFKRANNFFIFSVDITIIVTIITYMINPDLEEVGKGIEDSSSTKIKEFTGIDKVGAYVVNNGFGVP
ncbi:hypothetical protein ACTHO0_21395 [Cytobacillus praedii]|uniref:hypothetical protein n=1 Tax=Cytobacillus praedii TaxID=1742358 RepID=UPI003F80F826